MFKKVIDDLPKDFASIRDIDSNKIYVSFIKGHICKLFCLNHDDLKLYYSFIPITSGVTRIERFYVSLSIKSSISNALKDNHEVYECDSVNDLYKFINKIIK